MKVKFHLCTGGFCCHPEWSCMAGATLKPAEFPAHFGAIEHPVHGLVLFDTGYASHITQATKQWPYRTYAKLFPHEIPAGQEMATQLRQLGHTPSDVKWIIISHFHPDHIGGLKDFPAARFICAREAWESLHHRRGWNALLQAFLPDLLPADMRERVRWIEDAADCNLHEELPGFLTGKDLFGCGTLVAVALPGHAVGQYGLYLRDAQHDRPIFMIADACWRSKSYQHYALPPAITMALLHNATDYRATLLNLHRLSLVRNDILIVPSHCNEVRAAGML